MLNKIQHAKTILLKPNPSNKFAVHGKARFDPERFITAVHRGKQNPNGSRGNCTDVYKFFRKHYKKFLDTLKF